MTRIAARIRQPSLLRTPCSAAAMIAIGLLGAGAMPALALTPTANSTSSSQLLNNVILRGLVSDYRSSATFATSGAAGSQTLSITQLLPKIILDWNQFNLNNGDTIQFIQPSSTAAVLNRIYDANPTTISGAIKANGQVYLVNQNGILFHNGAQINTNSFFASTLNISDDTFNSSVTAGGLFTPAFAGGYSTVNGQPTTATPTGAITLGGGLGTAAPTISAQSGGAVVIIAPVINNQSGVIASPDGQVILAAGNAAYLGFSASNSTGFRGMLVEVTADATPVNLTDLIGNNASRINNTGAISADRGNVTLAALAINQSGRVSASTAMLTNGSIYLQANTLNDVQRGVVTLSADSVTATPLDLTDTTTLSEATSFTPYQPVVKITGQTIDVEGTITSHSGAITLDAQDPTGTSTPRIYLGPASTIDASGVWSTASDASNLLTFKVTSTELADAPDQKGGFLLGKTVTVDLREDSPLLDLSGYQQNQAQTLQQKAATAGTVTLTSGGDVVQHGGSVIDVSGGGVHYTGVTESTTQLLGADGKLYDIMSAPEALTYTAIASSFTDTQAAWGYSPVYSNLLMGASLKRPDYDAGASGGNLDVLTLAGATGVVLDGTLRGGVTIGSQQTAAAPRGASLVIGSYDASKGGQDVGVGSVTLQAGQVDTLAAGFNVLTPLSDASKTQLNLSTDIFGAGSVDAAGNYVTTGFDSVTINANGKITVPQNVTLNAPIGGSIILRANQVEIDGQVNVPSGNVTASVIDPHGSGDITLAQGAAIDTSGTWINDAIAGAVSPVPSAVQNPQSQPTNPLAPLSTINGGSITLTGPLVDLGSQSKLDVSAGGLLSTKSSFTGGAAGIITLDAEAAPTQAASPLTLGGTLAGYGFGTGGTLALTTGSAVQVGGASSATGLNLGAAFFQQGGFESYKVSSGGDLTIATGTVLQPQQQSLQIDLSAAQNLATGGDIASVASVVTLPASTRAPTSVAFSANGNLVMQKDSGIGTDVGATVGLSGVAGVSIDGTVYAPGGAINVALSAADQPASPAILDIGGDAILSTHGTFVAKPNDNGLVQGTLSAGGAVSLTAQQGAMQLDAGSVIDVGGASQTVDIPSALGSSTPYRQVLQSSNAGSVNITANDDVTLGGAIRGHADGSAAGGSFSLTLNGRGDVGDTSTGRRIVVTQTGAAQPTNSAFKDVDVSVDKLTGGGFDKLSLAAEDQVVFASDSTLAFKRGVLLDSHLIQVTNGANVVVSGAEIELADSFGTRTLLNPGSDLTSAILGGSASPPQASVVGTGSFSASAQTLDVFGNVTVSGTASTTLAATNDLRLSGRSSGDAASAQGATLSGSLVTAGNLTLSAAQVYPTTASSFTVAVADGVPVTGAADLTGTPTAGGQLTVTHGTGVAGDVLSAGGSLTLKADTIAQDGTVVAPLGTLNLQAGKSLTLGPTSVTSVSANGLTIPYGETQNGVTWTYAATGSDPTQSSLTSLPAKNISLNAPAVDVLGGAKVDISGGGDVAGIELVGSANGAANPLVQPNTYAIIPAANLTSAPIDPDIALTQNLGFGKGSAVYNSIQIGPGSAVPAGTYVLLPGYYALLKGAYIVQLMPGSTYANLQTGQTAALQNGLTVVPGVMTTEGTGVASSATIGVVVRPGTDATKLADYTVTNSSYFAALAQAAGVAAPLLPTDGGQLSIAATQRLTLNGTLEATLPTAASRSADVDITADKIALVDPSAAAAAGIGSDYLQIDTASLSKLDANLLIGGVRSTTSTGEVVTPTASDIVVANSAADPLKAPELLLAATDSITVKSGSVIDSSGTASAKFGDITVGGADAASGAILRMSNGGLVNITRPATDATQGTITVEAGATLNASGSIALDATRTTSFGGALNVASGGGLALVSGSVSLGQTDGLAGTSGLVLDNAQLAGFGDLGTLSIKSYGGIDLFGPTVIGTSSLANLVIDSASLTGHAGAGGAPASAQISAQNVSLVDTSATPASASPASDATAGAFVVSAGQITLGAGSKAIGGFSGVQLAASGEIVASGIGSLQAAGPLQLQAVRIDSVSGASQTWSAQEGSGSGAMFDAVKIGTVASAAPLADSTALGSRLAIVGSSIDDAGNIVMKSGSVSLQAQGPAASDGVVLEKGATIDAGDGSKNFQGTIAVSDAGQVTLASANGAVRLANGSSVNLAATGQGANAGSLNVAASNIDLSGTVSATSASGLQGNVSIAVGSLGDFSGLNTTLNAAGFTESRDVRVRNGDLVVAATDVVKAHQLTLESDSGALTVDGTLDASAALGGGAVTLSGHDVTLAAGSKILASGTSMDTSPTASYANGGSVTAIAEGGTLDFAAGAVVDVSAGAKGAAGSVLLRAPRTPANSVAATLQGQVLSASHGNTSVASVVIEGNQRYGDPASSADTVIDAAAISQYAAGNTAFMSAVDATALAAGILGDAGTPQGNVQVRPSVEVVSGGNVSITSNWNLTGAGWQLANGSGPATQAGSLVVRAAGNLTLQGVSIGNPDDTLQTAPTWNIQLTSGADLAATNASRVQSAGALAAQNGGAGTGDLTLDSTTGEASIRTGTGSITLSAGRDFVITAGATPATTGSVYTSGIAAIKDPSVAAAQARFTQGGGDITITAQRDAIGAGDEWMTEWYRTAVQAGGTDNLVNGAWWAYRPNFHDGVATLGGGNLRISAGNDINDLSAFTPTSGIENSGGTITTYGGGNLAVRAGNDIVGGQYLLSLGSGSISAGGDIGGAGVASQVFIMGMSGDAALQGASVKMSAGGAINLNTIDNPSSLVQDATVGTGPSLGNGNSSRQELPILSYAANSAVQLSALGGDIRIGNMPAAAAILNPDSGDDPLGDQTGVAVLPPKVDFTAFSGSIVYTGTAGGSQASQVLYPSTSGGLKLLAGTDIVGMSMTVSDTDASQFSIANISKQNTTQYGGILSVPSTGSGGLVTNTSTDTFINDVVALDGSITGVTFTFPARSRLWAADNITNPTLSLQNLATGDVSEIVAQQGSVRVITQSEGWGIDGPGSLLIQAGRNIDLGTAGLNSFGNLRNTALASTAGANIDLIAGYSGDVNIALLDPLFTQLQAAGTAKTPAAATTAVNSFFIDPSKVGPGDILSYGTSIQSNAGGSVNLLAPGGDITVGLPTPNKDKLIGVVTNAGGAIRSYLSGNFDINQGKVLTAQGGDILIYTADGSIDAGRGAKTSVTTPPPTRTPIVDQTTGVITGYTYSVPVAVAGSGIQTATSKPGGPDSVAPPAGNIYLFAPAGTIDAGEAGINSGGAIVIAALTVLNADNITSVGTSQGVPVTPPGTAGAAAAASAGTATADVNTSDAIAQAAAAAAAAGVTNFRPAILTVEVMGFGDKNCKETDKDCFAK